MSPKDAPPADNLLLNPGFEDGREGWTAYASLGSVTGFEVGADGKVEGEKALSVRGKGKRRKAGVVEAVSEPVPVEGGKRYELESAVRVERPDRERGMSQRVFWLDGAGKSFETTYGRETKVRSGRSARLRSSFKAPRKAVSARIAIGTGVSSSRSVAFTLDAVSLEQTQRG